MQQTWMISTQAQLWAVNSSARSYQLSRRMYIKQHVNGFSDQRLSAPINSHHQFVQGFGCLCDSVSSCAIVLLVGVHRVYTIVDQRGSTHVSAYLFPSSTLCCQLICQLMAID